MAISSREKSKTNLPAYAAQRSADGYPCFQRPAVMPDRLAG
jgi:hypothetical protein